MILKSKFDIGGNVFFYNKKEMRLDKGSIHSFNVSVSEKGKTEWSYFIKLPKKEGEFFSKIISVEEQFIYGSRDEAMEFALRFTANI